MNMFRLLRADEIDCRVSRITNNGLALLLYKDARCDMNILDETVGPFNWTREHLRDNANCVVSIWDENKKTWVSKEDTGVESNTEKEKGLASDSFKRACFNWGIGRELYTAPFIWVSASDCNIEEKQGRFVCNDKFEVAKIGYNEGGEICELEIFNTRARKTAFAWKMGKTVSLPLPEPKTPQSGETAAQSEFVPKCASCGAEISDRVHDYSVKYLGKPLCRDCQKKQA